MSCIKTLNFVKCVILLYITFDVAQSRFVYRSDIQREIQQHKVVATWHEAKEHCESQGAILASPIDSAHLNYMRSYIEVNDHTSAYFTGYKAVIHDGDFNYMSVEGVFLNELPEVVINMIEKIDPEDGDCLSMDRREMRAVPCWERLPYICYTKVTNVPSHVPTEVSTSVSTESSSGDLTNVVLEVRRNVSVEAFSSEKVNVTTRVTTGVPVEVTTEVSTSEPVDVTTEVITVSTEVTSSLPGEVTTDDKLMTIETTEVPIDVRMNNADEEEDLNSGYSYYGTGSLYKLHDTRLQWVDANATCAGEGGYLAVINDAAELRVILEIGDIEPHVLWTGLKKIDGYWRSVRGDYVKDIYDRWSVNLADETCGVIIDTGLLDDRFCYGLFPFICEKDVVPIEADA